MNIRPATAADAAAALAHLRRVARESDNLAMTPEEADAMTLAEEEAFLRGAADDPRRVFLLAEAGGAILGSAVVHPVSPRARLRHRAEIGVSVERPHWRRGVGTALLAAALDFARAAGFSQAELEVRADNAPALALYARFGLRRAGEIPGAFRLPGGAAAALVRMVLPLGWRETGPAFEEAGVPHVPMEKTP